MSLSLNESSIEQSNELSDPNVNQVQHITRGENKWKVVEMQQLHHKIKNLLFLNYTGEQIHKKLGCSMEIVSTVKHSPIIKEQLALMQMAVDSGCIDIQKEIASMQPTALLKLKEVIECGTLDGEDVGAKTRIKECNSIIDRYIGKPTQNVKSQAVTTHLTFDEIKELRNRAVSSGATINTSFKEVE